MVVDRSWRVAGTRGAGRGRAGLSTGCGGWSLPDWSLPGWVREVLDVLTFVFPVVLAFVLARAEVKRRRKQDELRSSDDEQG